MDRNIQSRFSIFLSPMFLSGNGFIMNYISNAVIHRDYRLPADVMVRIFSDRIEIESPGLLAGPVTTANIARIGAHSRNPLIIQHLRQFPDPPNLDAGEGVCMMFNTMQEAGLWPPFYETRPAIEREAVVIKLRNQNQPGIWEQVSRYIDEHGAIGNNEVRQLLRTDDRNRASRQLQEWVRQGLLVIQNPSAGKRARRYEKLGGNPLQKELPGLNDEPME